MKKDFVIKILFVENSLEEAEQIISLMRNSGIAVRPARATNLEQMRSAVAELEPDVVMFDPSVTDVSLDETMGVLEASGRDFALIGLVTNMDSGRGRRPVRPAAPAASTPADRSAGVSVAALPEWITRRRQQRRPWHSPWRQRRRRCLP
ncbi:hypothetical protein [Rhodanobacter lindaniclasticus]